MSFQMSDLITFDRMVTPILIKMIYWIGIACIALAGLVGLFGSFSAYGPGLKGAVVALIGAAVGMLLWRVWCELMIVMFNIYDVLKDIRNRGNHLS